MKSLCMDEITCVLDDDEDDDVVAAMVKDWSMNAGIILPLLGFRFYSCLVHHYFLTVISGLDNQGWRKGYI